MTLAYRAGSTRSPPGSVLASVEQALDDGAGAARHAPVVVPQRLLGAVRVPQHARQLLRLVAVDRQRIARRAGEEVAIVARPLTEHERLAQRFGVVLGD